MSRQWSGQIALNLRLEAGLRPEAVADRIGVHRGSVYAWESGREPQLRYAVALADLYQVSLDSLFVVHDEGDGSGASESAPENTDRPDEALPLAGEARPVGATLGG
jgi:transcriptional regulator with XRE-family HTH domain